MEVKNEYGLSIKFRFKFYFADYFNNVIYKITWLV